MTSAKKPSNGQKNRYLTGNANCAKGANAEMTNNEGETDMDKTMMIDYRDDEGELVRSRIDDTEFCVRKGYVYFISSGEKFSVPLDSVIQVYLA